MQHTLSYKNISISISSLGTELQSLKNWEVELLYQKEDVFWQRQSPILFPIVGALKDGSYRYDEKIYHLSQHGFARDKEWNLIEQTENSLTFWLNSDSSSYALYPFDFEIWLMYLLSESVLEVRYTVKNTGTKNMYFSLGGHPAFLIENISDYSIFFPEDDMLSIDRLQDGLISISEKRDLEGNTLPLSEAIFRKDALILRSLQSKKISFRKNSELILEFDRGNFPHFGIWKQPDAPFLCLEPWSGYADMSDASGNLEEKSWIIELSPDEIKNFRWSVKIESSHF